MNFVRSLGLATLVSLLPSYVLGQNFAGDMALSKVLIEGEGWQSVASGYGFTDAAATDDDGNFYFSGRRANQAGIYRITPDGQVEAYLENVVGVSGLQFSPDGRLLATRWGKNDLIVIHKDGSFDTLASFEHPNDLVITGQGLIFATGSQGVFLLNDQNEASVVATGLKSPNGISLSPDQGTLVVSEYQGVHVWAYRIEKDGKLSFGEPYMTMRLSPAAEVARGDGATTDISGRYYVTSDLGIQMFDATGRISGIISNPSKSNVSNVEFAGHGHRYLYVTAGGSIFRRLTKTRGFLFYQDFRDRPKP